MLRLADEALPLLHTVFESLRESLLILRLLYGNALQATRQMQRPDPTATRFPQTPTLPGSLTTDAIRFGFLKESAHQEPSATQSLAAPLQHRLQGGNTHGTAAQVDHQDKVSRCRPCSRFWF